MSPGIAFYTTQLNTTNPVAIICELLATGGFKIKLTILCAIFSFNVINRNEILI